jgi:RNA polymerase sigma-70 factor, ECF subfamily
MYAPIELEESGVTAAGSERKRVFDALFRENIAGIASYCRRHSPSPGEVDDAVAEVFLTAWRRLDDLPAGTSARVWLYATARRVMANQARARARRGRLRDKLSAQPVTFQAAEDSLTGRVQDALAALGARDREVLLLAEWEGLTPAEIATVLRCPGVTVRGRLHRARRRFRAAFESQEAEEDRAPVTSRPLPGRSAP